MPDLLATERETYEEAWSIDEYATVAPGERLADLFASIVPKHASVLDAGCGSAKGALALVNRGYAVTLADLTPSGVVPDAKHLTFHQVCLWNDLRHLGWFDWVCCCDVLEHIDPAFTMLTVARLLSIARDGLFLSISLTSDVAGFFVGKPLHQSVFDFCWWRDHLAQVGTVSESRDLLGNAIFVVKPRREVRR